MITTLQEKQLAMADRLEAREAYRDDLGTLTSIDATCNTCRESKHFNCADSIRTFVYLHKGHYTWFTFTGFVRATGK